jgi:hypothetical protein
MSSTFMPKIIRNGYSLIYTASGAIPEGAVVSLNSTTGVCTVQTSGSPQGIALNAAADGEPVSVGLEGIFYGLYGGSVDPGRTPLVATTGGKLVAAAAGVASGATSLPLGRKQGNYADGDLGAVILSTVAPIDA